MGLKEAAGGKSGGIGERELVALVGELPLLEELGTTDDAAEAAMLPAGFALAAVLLSGGSGGDSNWDMDGLVKGLTTVELETCRLAGGEKDVWTGCGKLGGSETCSDVDASCACMDGERGAGSGTAVESAAPVALDEEEVVNVERSADFVPVLVEAALLDLEED